MSAVTLRNHRGETVEVQEFSATEAKNSFGRVLDTVFSQGMVAISKRDRPTAVILSLDTYEALLEAQQNPLDSLSEDFDHLLRRMQAPQMRTAMAVRICGACMRRSRWSKSSLRLSSGFCWASSRAS